MLPGAASGAMPNDNVLTVVHYDGDTFRCTRAGHTEADTEASGGTRLKAVKKTSHHFHSTVPSDM